MNTTPRFFGTWAVPRELLIPTHNENRFHIDDVETHDGPAVKFPRGIPTYGDKVIVHITADACLRRGLGNHRSRVKLVLRVVPFTGELRDWQGPITISRNSEGSTRAYRIGRCLWLVGLPDGEPPEKYT